MKGLILYSSREGQTRAIASRIAGTLAETLECDVVDLHQADGCDLSRYERVLIGASIRYGHFDPVLDKFIQRRLAELSRMPAAFFSVNLTARKPEKRTPETNAYTRKFLQRSPWRPALCGVFAGALRYPRYRWFDRIMIQLIMHMTGGETDSSKEVEYTDWRQVDAFAFEWRHLTLKKTA
ncbi:menaquinone-dependent protoporphyrinogen IX dehydrogenase [Affinibrenneria salicis]|uniref:Protoporphyrinogen IX dehydrogenase [quinone] n=1 Tax=Affinibrenneria salicis TaxID=2590031 RepID=A0A5J5FV33_9GAMM|nr:menaquinone-dependent protoporphyrinogen IX dehydrogenase [Affinibrenneria salicis]KAA8997257.1 menaquinone-dependent protoporphyrinogen IX dehydrogenase [Affinibrenneria salicis]